MLKWSEEASERPMSSVRSFQSQLSTRRKMHRALQYTRVEQRDICFRTTNSL